MSAVIKGLGVGGGISLSIRTLSASVGVDRKEVLLTTAILGLGLVAIGNLMSMIVEGDFQSGRVCDFHEYDYVKSVEYTGYTVITVTAGMALSEIAKSYKK